MVFDVWLPCYGNIIVSRPRKLLFCPVPKVACSNWKMTLRQSSGLVDYADDLLAHDRERNGLVYFKQYNRLTRYYLINNPRYIKAVFVRNPWTRVLSAYRSKVENALAGGKLEPENPKTRYIQEIVTQAKSFCRSQDLVDNAGSDDVTFGEFLHCLENTTPDRLNEHWRPQWLISGFDRVRYDFIGRFENLDADAATLCRMTGLPALYHDEIRSVPATRSSEADILRRYYDGDKVAQVARIYRRDIDLLGYQPPIDA